MDRYIGLDAHASSCTLGVVGPSGKRLGSHVVETNARALIEVLRGIPRNLTHQSGRFAVSGLESGLRVRRRDAGRGDRAGAHRSRGAVPRLGAQRTYCGAFPDCTCAIPTGRPSGPGPPSSTRPWSKPWRSTAAPPGPSSISR